MRQLKIHHKGMVSLLLLAALGLTGCTNLSYDAQPTDTTRAWTQEELSEFRRIRNDPRLYGIGLDSEQYVRYLHITGQGR